MDIWIMKRRLYLDKVGKQFNNLKFLGMTTEMKHKKYLGLFECNCGKDYLCIPWFVFNDYVKSCGACHEKQVKRDEVEKYKSDNTLEKVDLDHIYYRKDLDKWLVRFVSDGKTLEQSFNHFEEAIKCRDLVSKIIRG